MSDARTRAKLLRELLREALRQRERRGRGPGAAGRRRAPPVDVARAAARPTDARQSPPGRAP